MSQSIPEQLNVDRREFADAVNALTNECPNEVCVLEISTEMWKIGFFYNFCSGAGIFSSAIVSVKEYQQR
ncbi:hypothetical protein Tco_0844062 [Tanacetum coccineum]